MDTCIILPKMTHSRNDLSTFLTHSRRVHKMSMWFPYFDFFSYLRVNLSVIYKLFSPHYYDYVIISRRITQNWHYIQWDSKPIAHTGWNKTDCSLWIYEYAKKVIILQTEVSTDFYCKFLSLWIFEDNIYYWNSWVNYLSINNTETYSNHFLQNTVKHLSI